MKRYVDFFKIFILLLLSCSSIVNASCRFGDSGEYQLGTFFDQTMSGNGVIPNLTVQSNNSIFNSNSPEKLSFSAGVNNLDKSGGFFVWESSCQGELVSNDDQCSSISWIPKNGITNISCDIIAHFGYENHLVSKKVTLQKSNQGQFVTGINTNSDSKVGLLMTMTAFTENNIGAVGYIWDFGDGATATGASVTHAYNDQGTYAAKVTATDSQNRQATAQKTIKILPKDTVKNILSINASSSVIQEGSTTYLTVGFDQVADVARIVSLSADSGDITYPATVTVPAGAKVASPVTITAKDDSLKNSNRVVKITAASQYAAALQTLSLTVQDNETIADSFVLGMSLSSNRVVESDGESVLVVYYDKPLDKNRDITLASSSSRVLFDGMSTKLVTIPSGSSQSAPISIKVDKNNIFDENTWKETITATTTDQMKTKEIWVEEQGGGKKENGLFFNSATPNYVSIPNGASEPILVNFDVWIANKTPSKQKVTVDVIRRNTQDKLLLNTSNSCGKSIDSNGLDYCTVRLLFNNNAPSGIYTLYVNATAGSYYSKIAQTFVVKNENSIDTSVYNLTTNNWSQSVGTDFSYKFIGKSSGNGDKQAQVPYRVWLEDSVLKDKQLIRFGYFDVTAGDEVFEGKINIEKIGVYNLWVEIFPSPDGNVDNNKSQVAVLNAIAKVKVNTVISETANVGEKTTITVTGADLPDTLDMQLADCTGIQKLAGAMATEVKYSCTFSSAGTKFGTIKDKAGSSYTLKIFSVNVNNVLPDLQVVRFQPPASIQPGVGFNVAVDIKNAGKASAGASTLTFYLRSATGATSELNSVSVPTVAAGQTLSLTPTVTIPDAGAYSFSVKIDSKEMVTESVESNNIASQSIVVQTLADLRPVNLQIPEAIKAGSSVNISVGIENIGGTATSPSSLGVWLSTDDILSEGSDTVLTMLDIPKVISGQVVSSTATVAIPASIGGARYVLLKADSKSVVDEIDETNNLIKKQINIANNLPTANPGNVTLNEDSPKTFALVGVDPEGSTLTYSLARLAQNGKVTLANNMATYTPNLNFNGADSFTFTVNDGLASSISATVYLSIQAVNDFPTANAGVDQTVDSGATVTLKGSGVDVDGDAITHSWVQTGGTPTISLSGANSATATFTAPSVSQNTKLTFTLTVSDGKGGVMSDNVDVTIKAGVDTKPDAFSFPERKDVERAVWLESDTITVSGINASASISVAGGEYSVNGGAYTNTAGTLSNGAKVKVRHLSATAFSGTVKTTLTIGGVSGIFTSTTRANGGNTPPVAENGTLIVAEGVQRDVILWASDADEDTLTYAVTGNPAHGTLGALNGNTLTYTPTAGYVGADSLTFSVTDSKGSVSFATITLSVETLAITDPNLLACVQSQLGIGSNQPTKAQLSGMNYLSCFDGNKKIGNAGIKELGRLTNLTAFYLWNSASDLTDLGALASLSKLSSFGLYSSPVTDMRAVGKLANLTSLSLRDNNKLTDISHLISLTKLASFSLSSSLVTDIGVLGKLGSLINLELENNSKLVDISSVASCSKLTRFVLSSSPVTDISAVGKLANLTGLVIGNNSKLTDISPVASLTKLTSFSLYSSPVTDISVLGSLANLTQLALSNNSKLTDISTIASFSKLTSFSLYSSPVTDISAVGKLVNLTSLAFYGNNDLTDISPVATLSNLTYLYLHYNPVSDISSVASLGKLADAYLYDNQITDVSSLKGMTNAFNLNLTGNCIKDVSMLPANIKVRLGTQKTGCAVADFKPDAFVFTDPTGVTPSSVVESNTITVSGINVPAVVSVKGGEYRINGGTYTNVAGGSVNKGDKLQVRHTSAAAQGVKTDTVLTIGGVSDTFTSTTKSNTPPTLKDISESLSEDSSKVITLVGVDAEGDSLTYIPVGLPKNGKLGAVTGNTVTYTPNRDFNGKDSFTVKANDGHADSVLATVNLQVNAVNDAPSIENATASTNEDKPVEILLSAVDVDGDSLEYLVGTKPANGAVVMLSNKAAYTPKPDWYGTDTFTVTASDGKLSSAPATVTVTVKPVNDAPIAKDQALSTSVGKALAIELGGTDVDGDSLTYNITQSAANGTTTGTGNKITYTPNTGWSGKDTIKFTVSDGKMVSASATVTITVTECAADNEPDNTSDQAMPVGLNSSTKRAICPETDVDWFTFTLSLPSSLRIETSGANGHDTRMWLYDKNKGELAFNDDFGNLYSRINYDCTKPLPAGTYYIKVDEYGQNSKIPEYTMHVQDVKSCVTDTLKTDLSVSVSNPSMITPDMLTTHTVTVSNRGANDAENVVLTVKTPADLMNLGNGSSKVRAEPVAYNTTQGTVDSPLSTTQSNVVGGPQEPPSGSEPHYKDTVFRLGTLKRGETATARVTIRYSGYVSGSTLQMSASAVTSTTETDLSNNSAVKPFTLSMKKIWQGCDYENMVWTSPTPPSASESHFHALLMSTTPSLNLFSSSNLGVPVMLGGDGYKWSGIYQDGSYPNGLFAVAKSPSSSPYVGVSTQGGIYWSNNQENWVAATLPVFVPMYDIAYAKGRYVAVGDSGVVLTSLDGIKWQQVTSSTSSQLRFVDFGNGEFVAGGQGVLLRSTDGVKWSAISSSVQGLMFGSVWNGSQYLLFDMFGFNHVIASRITSLATATPFMPAIDGQAKVTNWYAIYWQDSEYMALTGSGILTSKDGRNWVTRNPSVSYPYAAQRFGDRVVVVGAYGTVLTGACVPLPTASNGFAEQTDVPRSTYVESNVITVSGLPSATSVTVTGGYYRKNGGVYTTAKTTVVNGDTLQVRQKTSSSSATSVTATLTLGTTALPFKTTTLTVDTSPDSFGFAPLVNVAKSTWIESESIVITGINVPVNISVSGGSGQYRINGGEYTSKAASSVVKAGDVVQVRHLSSSLAKRTVTTTLTVGTAKPQFKTTTQ